MTHADFFAGIGGFSLGAHYAGYETIYTCEADKYRRKWLKQILPNAQHEEDIQTAQGPEKRADVWTAGFPCQDISLANPNATGITGSRSGLFFTFAGLVRHHRPAYVVLENSPMLIHRGLSSILTTFAQMGYDAEWGAIHKRAFGFTDERERLIVVAYPHQKRRTPQHVFSQNSYRISRAAFDRHEQLQSELSRIDSLQIQQDVIWRALQDNTRLPTGMAERREIEAYGDTICPAVAFTVMHMIKQHASHACTY